VRVSSVGRGAHGHIHTSITALGNKPPATYAYKYLAWLTNLGVALWHCGHRAWLELGAWGLGAWELGAWELCSGRAAGVGLHNELSAWRTQIGQIADWRIASWIVLKGMEYGVTGHAGLQSRLLRLLLFCANRLGLISVRSPGQWNVQGASSGCGQRNSSRFERNLALTLTLRRSLDSSQLMAGAGILCILV
jgi:hypothetical protein